MKTKTIHESIIEIQNLLIIKLLKDIKRLHKEIENNIELQSHKNMDKLMDNLLPKF